MQHYQQTVSGRLTAVATEAYDTLVVYAGPDHHAGDGTIIERCGRGDGRAHQIRAEFDPADERGMAWLRKIGADQVGL